MYPPPLLPTRIDTQWRERRNTQRHTLHVDSVESICILTYVCATRTWQMQVDPLLIICEIIEPQTTDNVYLWIRASFNHKIIPREKKIFWVLMLAFSAILFLWKLLLASQMGSFWISDVRSTFPTADWHHPGQYTLAAAIVVGLCPACHSVDSCGTMYVDSRRSWQILVTLYVFVGGYMCTCMHVWVCTC